MSGHHFGVDTVVVQPSPYPTDIYAKAVQPVDAAHISSYEEVNVILDKVRQTSARTLSGENRPNRTT